jgi:surfeit locus 1 family protein
MLRGVRIGGWRFRPGLAPSVAAAAFIVLTLFLGNWQTRRAEEKTEVARKLDEAMQGAVLSVPSSPADAGSFERRRVSVRGRFVALTAFFLDNKVLRGVAGYRVFTPLAIEGSNMHVLVDRGWIAAGDRSRLPLVTTPEGVLTLEGLAVIPSRRFLELAPEESTGALRQNLVIEREQERLGIKLQPFVIEQTSDAKDGLERARERPDAGVDRHRSYALQWYSFAVLTAILYVILNFRREPS